MDNISDKISKLQKAIDDNIQATQNFERKVTYMEGYFEENEIQSIHSLDAANWDREIGKIALSLEILKGIHERKANLFKL